MPRGTPLFGPSGNSESFYTEGYKHTWEAFAWLSQKKLSAFEYSFGRGVTMTEEYAALIKRESQQNGIAVSAHAPYYVSLANPDISVREKSIRWILEAAQRLLWMGGQRLVVHVGSVLKMERSEAISRSVEGLQEVLRRLDDFGRNVSLCIETMGKPGQIGTLDEILSFCAKDERLIPCIDFAHLHAIGGGALNQTEDFALVLDRAEDALGRQRAKNMHIHFSTVEYGAGGEKRHRTFADTEYGPRFDQLAPLLCRREYTPVIICESRGSMAEDAQSMLASWTNCVPQKRAGRQISLQQ